MNKKLIRLTESDLHRIVKESVNRILNETSELSIYDDKNRLFDAFKNMVHAFIWENNNIGGTEELLDYAENKYLQECGQTDLEVLHNKIQKYVWDIVKQSEIQP